MYNNQIPQQDPIGVGEMIGAFINPINHYQYNPWMWSARRGQVKVPILSGNSIKGVAKYMRKWGGNWGNSTVDFMKDKGGLGNIGGVLTDSESIWVGSAPMWSDDTFAISTRGETHDAEAALSKRKAKANRIIKGNERNYYKKQIKLQKSRLKRMNSYRKNVLDNTLETGTTADYIKTHNRMKLYQNSIQTKLDKAMSKSGMRSKITGNFWERSGMRVTRVTQSLWDAKSTIAKVGMRVGTSIMKGFAYYETAKFAYSMINMAFEPLGRSAVSAADSLFDSRRLLGLPEMGGNLKMEYLTRGAATERQRALQAIQKSRLNARQGLGGEAAMIHR